MHKPALEQEHVSAEYKNNYRTIRSSTMSSQ